MLGEHFCTDCFLFLVDAAWLRQSWNRLRWGMAVTALFLPPCLPEMGSVHPECNKFLVYVCFEADGICQVTCYSSVRLLPPLAFLGRSEAHVDPTQADIFSLCPSRMGCTLGELH